jgi:hypothetical protein
MTVTLTEAILNVLFITAFVVLMWWIAGLTGK